MHPRSSFRKIVWCLLWHHRQLLRETWVQTLASPKTISPPPAEPLICTRPEVGRLLLSPCTDQEAEAQTSGLTCPVLLCNSVVELGLVELGLDPGRETQKKSEEFDNRLWLNIVKLLLCQVLCEPCLCYIALSQHTYEASLLLSLFYRGEH